MSLFMALTTLNTEIHTLLVLIVVTSQHNREARDVLRSGIFTGLKINPYFFSELSLRFVSFGPSQGESF